MKVDIRDKSALSSLPLLSLRAYLKSQEWGDQGEWGKRATIYAKESGGRNWEILIPLVDTVADYAASMAESIAILAAVEERSQLDVFNDISGTGSDIIRMRSTNGLVQEPLSLRQSANLLSDACDMLASAARAVEKPQATYRGNVSADVTDYLDKVHPLPSYYEGYALTLHSPVPPKFGIQGVFDGYTEEPFSRRANRKLAEGLQYIEKAIAKATNEDALDSFEQAVPYGVSANLCDSVSKLAKKGHGIEIGLVWADVRPSTIIASHFPFSVSSADILEQVAGHFRSKEPYLGEYLIADVVQLEREPDQFDGRSLILARRDEPPFRIRVQFEARDYDTVIRAHKERKPISVEGDIHQEGRGYVLRNPRSLRLMEEDDENA